MYLLSINLASKHHIKTLNALDTNAVTRPAEEREIQEGQDTGAKGAAAAAMIAEPAGDGDNEVCHRITVRLVERRGTFLRPVRGHIIKEYR
jgi:hypothetical protein